jgi:cytochrome c oxidase subunit IV
MSEHNHAVGEHPTVPARTFVLVWVALVAITGIEVFLAYIQLEPTLMLGILMLLSVVKAGCIMAWFMHLKYEQKGLSLMLVPAMIFCISMMLVYILWDAIRLSHMRPPLGP